MEHLHQQSRRKDVWVLSTFPFLKLKLELCFVWPQWFPQPCREYVLFIALASQTFLHNMILFVCVINCSHKNISRFFFLEVTFPTETDPWTCMLSLKILYCIIEIKSTKTKISLIQGVFYPGYADIQSHCLNMKLMGRLAAHFGL